MQTEQKMATAPGSLTGAVVEGGIRGSPPVGYAIMGIPSFGLSYRKWEPNWLRSDFARFGHERREALSCYTKGNGQDFMEGEDKWLI